MKNNFDIRETMKDRRIIVIIPVFNNVKTISETISETKKYCEDIIVINDGSTDGTRELLEKTEGIELISYERNRGKGYALKKGFKRARERGYCYAITMDGDMQHIPSEIEHLLLENINNPGAVIIGSRGNIEDFRRSKGSRFANKFSNFWFTVQTWNKLKDTQSGFRLYPVKKMWWLPIITSRYEAELEILILFHWHFVSIKEVDVKVYYPAPEKRISSFRPGRDFIRISLMNTLATLCAVIYGWPLMIVKFFLDILRTVYGLIWFFIIVFIIMTPFSLLVIMFIKDNKKRSEYIKWGINLCGQLGMSQMRAIGNRTSIANSSCEDFKKPALIICNHQSHFDILVLQSLNKYQVFLTNDWAWNNVFYGHIIHLANFFPSSLGIDSLIENFKEVIKDNNSITVFPEGTRSMDDTIGRFHQGAFAIADALNLDIIPIILYGTGKILPKHGRIIKSGKIHCEIEHRIPKEEYKKIGSYKEMASYFRSYYSKRYSEIRDKIEQDV